MNKPVLVVAHARSGSTYLCQLLAAFTGMRSYLELFHTDPGRMIAFLGDDWPEVRRRLGLGDDPADARLAVCRQPDRLVDCLASLHPDATISLKIFPPHLDRHQLALLVPRCRGLIMVRRNLLHTYISRTIALATGVWSGTDTSRTLIRFVQEHFESHVAWVARFHATVGAIAHTDAVPITWLDYSTLCTTTDPEPMIRQALAATGVVDAGPFRHGHADITRQDRRRSALDKVTNPDELRAYLGGRGLIGLLESDDDGAMLYEQAS